MEKMLREKSKTYIAAIPLEKSELSRETSTAAEPGPVC